MGLNSGLPLRVTYAAYDTSKQEYAAGDSANHTIQLILNGVLLVGSPINGITDLGYGVYEIELTDAERSGVDLVINGVSSTENIIICPVQYSADTRWNELLEDDGSGNLRNTAKSVELAPVADISALATSQEISELETHGDTEWVTADTSLLALEASVQTVITTGGTGPWTTADISGLALEASVQTVITTGGPGPWTTGGGGGSEQDWTDDERNQIRYRLGVDGSAAMPTADPDLAQKSDLDDLDVNVTAWAGSADPVNSWAINTMSIKLVTVDESVTPATTTEFETNLTETDVDHWKNRAAIFVTGNLTYQASVITGYSLSSGKGKLTVAGFTRAPLGGDTLIIV